jgi:hypothetical protein
VSTDGLLRDNGRDFELVYREEVFRSAIGLVGDTLASPLFGETELLIDAGFTEKTGLPVPLGDYGESRLTEKCASGAGTSTALRITVAENTDRLLSASTASLIATADSRVIDRLTERSPARIVDIPRRTLDRAFSPDLPNLKSLVNSA